MKKNDLLRSGDNIIRILDIKEDSILIIDCVKRTMPAWTTTSEISCYAVCTENELQESTDKVLPDLSELKVKDKKTAQERFTLIAPILPFVSNKRQRGEMITKISETKSTSKQTIRYYLCLYLAYQNMTVLAPKGITKKKELSADEKNMRWGLNKFFYNQNKNSLNTAYTLMLKEKYCDDDGVLLPEHPSFSQFRYFYRKHKKMQTYYISRNGIKDYQKNHRPLLGDRTELFAPNIGVGMLDSTVCDIYLVNESGNLIGRPSLFACIDSYSGMCCGYSLTFENGICGVRGLLLNIISDKKKYCKERGILINNNDWDCSDLPATLVTDMGNEYKSDAFEHLAELGVTIVNLPSYRPELKGMIEKFFDVIQELYKPYLKGKGVIMPDFQQRGAHDYRKDACLTMEQFDKIILNCILYYNTKRIIKHFPSSDNMIQDQVKPFANEIWNWGKTQPGANLINVSNDRLVLTLLPRTSGKFSRNGLKVNKLRYKRNGYTEKFLSNDEALVAYNPDNVTKIWLIEDGEYIPFDLIETQYEGKKIGEVEEMQYAKKRIVKTATDENKQAQIDLANSISLIADSVKHKDVQVKNVRKRRKQEIDKRHNDYLIGDEI